MPITSSARRFIEQIKRSDPKVFYSSTEEISRIQVDSFVSRVAFIYEKIRNAIDYKEDHLMRKAAIFRILQRRLMIKVTTEDLSLGLVKELIRAGYLENNLIPFSKTEEVDKIITKYLTLYNLSGSKKSSDNGAKLFKWLLGLCSCEIEECLMPPLANQALVEYMFKVMRPVVAINDPSSSDLEKDLYIYLAIYRALVKSDEVMMDYKLLRYFYPDWKNVQPVDLLPVAKKINNLKKEIEKRRKYYLAEKLYRFFKKSAFVFYVLRDIISENPDDADRLFKNPAQLELAIRSACDKMYKNTRTKLRRSIVRVVIYLFLTKMVLALILEFPYDYYIAHKVMYLPLAINALFPPFLIFLLGIFIRIPSKKNTNRVVALAQEVVEQPLATSVKTTIGGVIKRSKFFVIVFYALYLALFYLSFSVLLYLLNLLKFNIFSKLIFLLFLSLVSFFGIKMRMKVKDLTVIDKKENPLVFLVNLFALPFLKAGHWLSEKFSKINVFVFILDFIIEAPLKIFLEVIEEWIAFLKEKKDEMYSKE
ncbi:MAG: hypothetical protein WCV73_03030 [Patescibacteria group bacterium]|jgi:hypothetical protein